MFSFDHGDVELTNELLKYGLKTRLLRNALLAILKALVAVLLAVVAVLSADDDVLSDVVNCLSYTAVEYTVDEVPLAKVYVVATLVQTNLPLDQVKLSGESYHEPPVNEVLDVLK